MATGYKISTGVDLDTLFMARAAAAIADVGYKNASAVDLSQLFEPRGATTAIANTGFKNSAGTDLAQLFKDINAAPVIITRTMTAGQSGNQIGFRNSADGWSAYGSMSSAPEWTKSSQNYRLGEFNFDTSLANEMFVRVSHATTTPPNTDACWSFIAVTGTFSGGGGTGRKVLARASYYVTNTGNSPGGRPHRTWQINQAGMNLINGNVYTWEIG